MRPFARHPLRSLLLLLALVLPALPVGSALAQPRRLHIESIEVSGADAALQRGVSRLLDLRSGDEVDAERLQIARRRLLRSGWYDEVELYTARGSAPGRLRLHVDGTLDRSPHLETGFGHDPLAGWTLDVVGVSIRHLLGNGSTARLAWQLGLRQSMLVADVEVPAVAGSDFDLLARARVGAEEWNAYSGGDLYQQTLYRASFHLGGRWNLTSDLDLTGWVGSFTAESGDLVAVTEGAPEPMEGLTGDASVAQDFGDIALDLTWNTLDAIQPWRRGSWAQLRLQASGTEEGDPFARAHAAYRGAAPLPGESALALRVDGKWSDRATPYHLRPWFGGVGSVRGFRDASLSGGFGARAWTAAAAEPRTPLFRRGDPDARVHGAVFVDTGTWTDSQGDRGSWSTSVGWGLRVRVPWVERIAVDFAVPLTPTATDDAFWVHGGLGFGF